MATRNIVPRANEEGGLGTAAKKWLYGFIKTLAVATLNALTLTAQTIGFTIAGGTTSKTLTVEGDSVIGSDLSPDAGPTFDHLHLTSGQIGFPATQVPSTDPNTLDDYEEGTWIPVLKFGTTVQNLTSYFCAYVKVGRWVFISALLNWVAGAGGTGAVSIEGLPFVSRADWSTQIILAGCQAGRITTTEAIFYNLDSSTSVLHLAGQSGDITDTNMVAGPVTAMGNYTT